MLRNLIYVYLVSYSNAADRARFAEKFKKFNLNWDRSNAMASPEYEAFVFARTITMVQQDKNWEMILALNYANTRKFSVADIASFDGSGQVADLHRPGF